MAPVVISEDIPYDEQTHHCDPLDLNKPLGGHLWWNSLYWTNFPPLAMFDQGAWNEHPDAEIPASLRELNSDGCLSEQYVTFCSAREDLCSTSKLPDAGLKLTVECMQYEGVRDVNWDFPMKQYMPRRDNHQPNDIQSRRFWDNGVIHLGLNAEEFSERVRPVGELDACIHIADKSAVENATWGYYHAVLRIGGWPYRIKRVGTFEGCGTGGHRELTLGICHWNDQQLWDLLEGGQPQNAEEGVRNLRKGQKFWASLMDLDWLGRKRDERKEYDPEVPVEKAYVWFVVEDTIEVPSTGRKGVKVRLLEEGIIPAWMDLNFLQVFAGNVPLGYMNEIQAEDSPAGGSVQLFRTPSDDADDSAGQRKVVVKNRFSKIVFDEPMNLQINDFVDFGWAIHDVSFRGASLKLGPKPGKWIADVGSDEGTVQYKSSGPPPLTHGEGKDKVVTGAPKSDFIYERRLVM